MQDKDQIDLRAKLYADAHARGSKDPVSEAHRAYSFITEGKLRRTKDTEPPNLPLPLPREPRVEE